MEGRKVQIYQLKDDDELARLFFRSYQFITQHGYKVSRENYELIYTCNRRTSYTLDDIYEEFNINHPLDFTGHSLSVGDVVVRTEDGVEHAYYVDDFGFKEVPEFLEVTAVRVSNYSRIIKHNSGWFKAKVTKETSDGNQLSWTEYQSEGSDALSAVIRQAVNQIKESPGSAMDSFELSKRLAKLMDDLDFNMVVKFGDTEDDIDISATFMCEPADRIYKIRIEGVGDKKR